MSPAAIDSRTAELDTSSPCTRTAGWTCDSKPKFPAEFGKFLYPGGGAVPKAEVATLVQAANAEHIHQHLLDKRPRRQVSQGLVKRQDHYGINARTRQQPHPFPHRCKQTRRLLRPQNLLRVGIETHRDGAGISRACFRRNGSQDPLVPEVHSIKVADRGNRRTESRRDLVAAFGKQESCRLARSS